MDNDWKKEIVKTYEVNFDGLIGPTHNYAGLSFGNLASDRNRGAVSSPRSAAIQGLEKMKRLHDLGIKQAVLPPLPRPHLSFLRRLGFRGTDEAVLAQAAAEQPLLLANAYSASSMWAANAATVSPSADTQDDKVHLTPANLFTTLHRSLETAGTEAVLRQIFADSSCFVIHTPLPVHSQFADEGAANFCRFATGHGKQGVEMMVYGRDAAGGEGPEKYPARQTRQACEAIFRNHRLDPGKTVLAQQNPAVVDQGVFHNDVIAVANETVFLYHEDAFVDSSAVVSSIEERLETELQRLCVKRDQVSVAEAVESYLFNSQLVTLPDGGMTVIAPEECRMNDAVRSWLEALPAGDNSIETVHYFDVRESMKNGGGPACLRLRVVLTEKELAAVHQHILFDDSLYKRLKAWVIQHYRDTLSAEALSDPALARQVYIALQALEEILQLKLCPES